MLKDIVPIVMFLSPIYLAPLVPTVVLEVLVAAVLGYRRRADLSAVVLVNLVTNPALNYLVWHRKGPYISAQVSELVFVELIVIVVETVLLMYALHGSFRRMFRLSVAMNAASAVIGTLIIANVLRASLY